MPALEAFGRRWHIASDDFVIPQLFEICFRSTWLAIVGGISWKNYTILSHCCDGQFYISFYVYGLLILSSLVIFANIILILNSKAGPIIDKKSQRKHVPLWILSKWILQLTELVWNTAATVWALQGKLACTLAVDIFTTVLITTTWMLITLRLFLIYITFDPIGSYKFTVKDNGVPDSKLTTEWQRKLKLLSFLFTGKRMVIKDALEEVGYFFGSMFEDTDIVPSDIVAGIILLILRQKQTKTKQPNENEATEIVHPEENPMALATLVPALESWNSLSQLHHFSKYSKAIYTWSMLLMDGGMTKMKDLWREIICCGCMPCKSKLSFDVTGDNCYFLHSAGLKAWNLENTDVIYADFKNDIFELPFFIAVDHPKKSIVVSIRGSVFLNDVLVDAYARPHPIGVPGLPESFKIHHGMLKSAHLIKEKLDRLQLLPKLSSTYPDYNLVLTGSSLGGGMATALAFILRNDYPSLKCYSYSSPGGTLSLDAAEYCNSFVISVTYGDDYIARIGFQAVEALKYQIMEAITECQTPKYQVLLGGLYMMFGGNSNNKYFERFSSTNKKCISEERNTTVVVDIEPGNCQIESISSSTSMKTTIRKLQPFEKLYPPGRLLYIRETESFHLGHKNPNYKGLPRWTIRWAERSEFGEFVLSSRFLFDHLPFRMSRCLKKLAEEEINVSISNSTATE